MMTWAENRPILRHHHQLRGSVLPIKACVFNSNHQHILAADLFSLRLWSLRKEIAVANFPRGTPGPRWLMFHEPTDLYFLFHDEQSPKFHRNSTDSISLQTGASDEVRESHPDAGIGKILDANLNILVNFRPHETVLAVELHPTAPILFTAGEDGTMLIQSFSLLQEDETKASFSSKRAELGLEPLEWQPLAKVTVLATLEECKKDGPIELLHYSARKGVIIGGAKKSGTLWAWQSVGTKLFRKGRNRFLRQLDGLAPPADPITCIDHISDIVVCAHCSGTIRLWKTDIYTPLAKTIPVNVGTLQAHQGAIHSVFTKEQSVVPRKLLFTASQEGMRAWAIFNVRTGANRRDSISIDELEAWTPLPKEDDNEQADDPSESVIMNLSEVQPKTHKRMESYGVNLSIDDSQSIGRAEELDFDNDVDDGAKTAQTAESWQTTTKQIKFLRMIEIGQFHSINNPPSKIKLAKHLQPTENGKAPVLRVMTKATLSTAQGAIELVLGVTGGLIDILEILCPKRSFCSTSERIVQVAVAVVKGPSHGHLLESKGNASLGEDSNKTAVAGSGTGDHGFKKASGGTATPLLKHYEGKTDHLILLLHNKVQIYDGWNGEKWQDLKILEPKSEFATQAIINSLTASKFSRTGTSGGYLSRKSTAGGGGFGGKLSGVGTLSHVHKSANSLTQTGGPDETPSHKKQKASENLPKQRGVASCVCYNSALRRVVVGMSDGTLQLMALKKSGLEHPPPQLISDPHALVSVIAIASLNHPTHYLVSGDGEGTLTLWNLASYLPFPPPSASQGGNKSCMIHQVEGHPTSILGLKVVECGQKAFGVQEVVLSCSTSAGSIIKLWGITEANARALQMLACFLTPTRVRCTALLGCDPDGVLVIVGAENGAVEVWDVRGGLDMPDSPIQSAFMHTSEVVSVDAHQDNGVVLTAGADRSMVVYSATDNPLSDGLSPLHSLQLQHPPDWAIFCPIQHSSRWNILVGTYQKVWRVVVRDDNNEGGLHTFDHEEDETVFGSWAVPDSKIKGRRVGRTTSNVSSLGNLSDTFDQVPETNLTMDESWAQQKQRNNITAGKRSIAALKSYSSKSLFSTGTGTATFSEHPDQALMILPEDSKWSGNYMGLKGTEAEVPFAIVQRQREMERASKIKESRRKLKYKKMARTVTRVVYNEMGEAKRIKVPLQESTAGQNSQDALSHASLKQHSELQKMKNYTKPKIPTRKVNMRAPVAQLAECPSAFLSFWSLPQQRLNEDGEVLEPPLRRPMEFRPALETVREVLMHKGMTDLEEEREVGVGVPRPSLAEYIYKHFASQYGVVQVAEEKLLALLDTVIAWRNLSIFRMFGRYINLFDIHARSEPQLTGTGSFSFPGTPEEMIGPSGLMGEACDLYTEALAWLKERNMIKEATVVKLPSDATRTPHRRKKNDPYASEGIIEFQQQAVLRSHAAICTRELTGRPERCFGTKLLDGVVQSILGLPDLMLKETNRRRGGRPHNHGTLDPWEQYVDVDSFLEKLINEVEKLDLEAMAAADIVFTIKDKVLTVRPRNINDKTQKRREIVGNQNQNLGLMAKPLLDRFIANDESRTGCIEPEAFATVIRAGAEGLFPCWERSKILDQVTPYSVANGEWGGICDEERTLQKLLLRYKDQYDGAVCYLDFWAMLFVYLQTADSIPEFKNLPHIAMTQKRGMDKPDLEGLHAYVQSVRILSSVPSPLATLRHFSSTMPESAGPMVGANGDLYLNQQAASDAPGTLTISRPPLRNNQTASPTTRRRKLGRTNNRSQFTFKDGSYLSMLAQKKMDGSLNKPRYAQPTLSRSQPLLPGEYSLSLAPKSLSRPQSQALMMSKTSELRQKDIAREVRKSVDKYIDVDEGRRAPMKRGKVRRGSFSSAIEELPVQPLPDENSQETIKPLWSQHDTETKKSLGTFKFTNIYVRFPDLNPARSTMQCNVVAENHFATSKENANSLRVEKLNQSRLLERIQKGIGQNVEDSRIGQYDAQGRAMSPLVRKNSSEKQAEMEQFQNWMKQQEDKLGDAKKDRYERMLERKEQQERERQALIEARKEERQKKLQRAHLKIKAMKTFQKSREQSTVDESGWEQEEEDGEDEEERLEALRNAEEEERERKEEMEEAQRSLRAEMEMDEAKALRDALNPPFGRLSSRKSSSRGTDTGGNAGFAALEAFEEASDEDLSTIASKGFSVESFKKAPIPVKRTESLPEQDIEDEEEPPPHESPEPEPEPPSEVGTEEPATDDDSEFDLAPAAPPKPAPVKLETLPSKSSDGEQDDVDDEEISVWSEEEEKREPARVVKSPRIPFIPAGIDNESSLMGLTDPTYATIAPKFWRFKSHARASEEGTKVHTAMAYGDSVNYDPLEVGGFVHGSGVDVPDSARSSIVDPEDNIEHLQKKKGPLGDLSHLYQTSDLSELKKLPHVYLVQSVDWETYFSQQEAAIKSDDEPVNGDTLTEEEKALRERKSLLKNKLDPEDCGTPSRSSSRPSENASGSPYQPQKVLPLFPEKVVEGKVNSNAYAYYYIQIDDPDTSLHFRLKSVQGDADMFISVDCLPSMLHHQWKTISITSEKSINIYPHHKDSKPGKYVVAVYARAHKAKYKLVVQKKLGEVDESEHMASTRKIVRRLSLLSKYKVSSLLQDFESASNEVEHKVVNEAKKQVLLNVNHFQTQEEIWSNRSSLKYAGYNEEDCMLRLQHPDAELYQPESMDPNHIPDLSVSGTMDQAVQNIDDSMLKWRPFFKEEMEYANTSKNFNSMKELQTSQSIAKQQTRKRSTKNLSFLNVHPSPVQYSLSTKNLKPSTSKKMSQKREGQLQVARKGSNKIQSMPSQKSGVSSLPSITPSLKKVI